ncbi:hypothetical protein [Acidithiobacillus ferrivorans]|nr:hypothetical protein [Acidithiobacillus ferrivorans]
MASSQSFEMKAYTEDSLVRQITVDYLVERFVWRSVLAYNEEHFGLDSVWEAVQ